MTWCSYMVSLAVMWFLTLTSCEPINNVIKIKVHRLRSFTLQKTHFKTSNSDRLLLSVCPQPNIPSYPLRGNLAWVWIPVDAGNPELLAMVTNGDCWSCRKHNRKAQYKTADENIKPATPHSPVWHIVLEQLRSPHSRLQEPAPGQYREAGWWSWAGSAVAELQAWSGVAGSEWWLLLVLLMLRVSVPPTGKKIQWRPFNLKK